MVLHDLVWPWYGLGMALYGLVWPCMALLWSHMALYGLLWQNIGFFAVIDPNSFGLVVSVSYVNVMHNRKIKYFYGYFCTFTFLNSVLWADAEFVKKINMNSNIRNIYLLRLNCLSI